ncbi:MAG: hypothetical protein M3R14_17150 [Acidobacteriota bacterium]|nr:hypothetical protein [Acidobacteriota bacterium]
MTDDSNKTAYTGIGRETINAELVLMKVVFNRLVDAGILRVSPAKQTGFLKRMKKVFTS